MHLFIVELTRQREAELRRHLRQVKLRSRR